MIKIHFINVGHGDCIVVEFKDSDRTAVIDINMSENMDEDSDFELINESINLLPPLDKLYHQLVGYSTTQLFEKAGYNIKLTNPVTYIERLKANSVFRFISTHPHMDHLSGIDELNDKVGITNFWIIKNSFTQDESKLNDSQKNDWNLYKKYRDTDEYRLGRIIVIRPMAGTLNRLWDEDKITILAPNASLVKLAKEKDNRNIMSYVLLIEYGGHKIILGGDAEEDTWKYIYENYPKLIKVIDSFENSCIVLVDCKPLSKT
ncbi:hypothetical protein EZS27_016498 [termite gut metagenome]|uniref:Metallo-beta-lactamase domain-containing protein n=1 Tax=termite gut metagenome TaxID=433724 RepID=A0A5J4RMZ3_9ZZZZ